MYMKKIKAAIRPAASHNLAHFLTIAMVMMAPWAAWGTSTVITASFSGTQAPGWIFSGSGTNNLGVTNTAFLTAASGIDASGKG